MFRVMELRDGKVDLYEGTEHVGPPPAGVLRWIDLRSQDDSQLELLRTRFDFHPLAIEDCGHEDQRPKLEEYKDHIFLVTQGFACATPKVEELHLHELHSFLGEQDLASLPSEGWLGRVVERLKAGLPDRSAEDSARALRMLYRFHKEATLRGRCG